MCCNPIKGRVLRITYNNYDSFFGVNEKLQVIDTTKYEGPILQSFIDNHQLVAELLNAQMSWGSIDTRTGLWTGLVGNVRIFICFLCLETKSKVPKPSAQYHGLDNQAQFR